MLNKTFPVRVGDLLTNSVGQLFLVREIEVNTSCWLYGQKTRKNGTPFKKGTSIGEWSLGDWTVLKTAKEIALQEEVNKVLF